MAIGTTNGKATERCRYRGTIIELQRRRALAVLDVRMRESHRFRYMHAHVSDPGKKGLTAEPEHPEGLAHAVLDAAVSGVHMRDGYRFRCTHA